MHHVTRMIVSALFITGITGGAWAMEDGPGATSSSAPGMAEYKRADANFYGKGDVLRAHPSAVVVPKSGYTQSGDSYFFTPQKKAPKSIYIETVTDWIEPITPPDMPASLGVPPDAMQIREPQGDVQVALPSAPTNFSPVTAGMTLPNGAVLKTGDGGTVAVLFGGVDSARLMPNSEAAVQQTVTADARSAEVDLTTGGVFSKVGTQVGVKGKFEVHTPSGNASAEGGDFVTVIANGRTDVWVAAGRVALNGADGKTGPVATSDGTGPLKVLRMPAIADSHASFLADTETLSALLNFIPLADQKIKGLRDKASNGTTLTANEQAYLARLKKVPCVIKLTLVEPPAPALKPAIAMTPSPLPPPAPAPEPAPAPVAPAAPVVGNPATAETPAVVAAPSAPGGEKPLVLRVRTDGKINFQKATYTVEQLRGKLVALAKTAPGQALAIRAGKTVSYDEVEPVIAICHDAGFQNVSVSAPPPAAALNVAPETPEHPADNLPAPGLLMHPSMEPQTGDASTPENPPTTNAPTTAVP